MNNWWGDINRPNFNGDSTAGNITTVPFLTTESSCIETPPTNTAPFAPSSPTPDNNAVRIPVITEGQPVSVVLSFTGGDPNPWDTLTYSIFLGTDEASPPLLAENLTETTFNAEGLTTGTTNYWYVVSKDNTDATTKGPIWQFTTLGEVPDLVIPALIIMPTSDIEAGQTVTLTATVENSGQGPLVDAVRVNFLVDDQSVGTKMVSPVLKTGTSTPVSLTWTATAGIHALRATVDDLGIAPEGSEENNEATRSLPEITDKTPPTLKNTIPQNAATVSQVMRITVSMADAHSEIDDAKVIESFKVTGPNALSVSGAVTEEGNTFTFTPTAVPLPDGAYQVSVLAIDAYNNTLPIQFGFTADTAAPVAPTLTGGTLLSGIIQVRPFQNRSNQTSITLSGQREDHTRLLINGSEVSPSGAGDWSVAFTLTQGDNALEIVSEDTAGNQSTPIFADIRMDSIPPG